MITNQNCSAEAFLKRVKTDARIRKELEQIEATGPQKLLEIALIGTANGFNFTAQEYEKAIADQAPKSAKGRKMAGKDCVSGGCMN